MPERLAAVSDDRRQQLTAYDRAVGIVGSTSPEIFRDERGSRELAGRRLARHATSDRAAARGRACRFTPGPAKA
ncbi:hypothetical protein SACT1_7330 [Streptomyces sp. ACT-1]|nr:hypothetical protein SACT1_7330 [Streptomyces sp. ACT-1]